MAEEEDDFDLFSSQPLAAVAALAAVPSAAAPITTIATASAPSDYFSCVPGSVLGGRYVARGKLGDGTFSTVVLVERVGGEQQQQQLFAAKVLRGNETMQRAGEKERELLRDLHDPVTHPCLVALVDSFQMDAHLVLVFERMEMNLRVCLDRFGKNVGLSLDAVQSYLRQLFSALDRLQTLRVVHGDLKPDNILVSTDLTRVKIADFGSAVRLDREQDVVHQPAPYLVSRYYRAPEVILACAPVSCAVDVWALCVTGFELCSGRVLFPGQTNNDQLLLMQRCLGRFSNGMVRRHIAVFRDKLEKEPHFDDELRFKSHEPADAAHPDVIVRRLVRFPDVPLPENALRGRVIHACGVEHTTILPPSSASSVGTASTSLLANDGEARRVLEFVLLLEAGLKLNPETRVDAHRALRMGFLQSSRHHHHHHHHHYNATAATTSAPAGGVKRVRGEE